MAKHIPNLDIQDVHHNHGAAEKLFFDESQLFLDIVRKTSPRVFFS